MNNHHSTKNWGIYILENVSRQGNPGYVKPVGKWVLHLVPVKNWWTSTGHGVSIGY